MKNQDAFAARFDVSRETLERLAIYHALLNKWNPRINLVAPATIKDAWTRHFADSAQLLDLVSAPPRLWADLGSGGGFPGAVLALMAAEIMPETRFVLVESDQRKATFLRTVAREAAVGVDVVASRIEDTPPLGADVVSARALAPLVELLGFVERHISDGGIALLPKGVRADEELAEARKTWSFEVEQTPSITDSAGKILRIGGIKRV